jgi:hypothetical protein
MLLAACQAQLAEFLPDPNQAAFDELRGAVTSAKGPEAGVWVIAETNDLSTKFAKIVVTDEQGRYLMPDLPKANYDIWVRGYGLVDSPKVKAAPGHMLDLKAVPAPSAAAAAEYYPPIYWYSLLRIPGVNEFPGTGSKGNGIAEAIGSQQEWLNGVKTNGCMSCHALGTKATRSMPKEFAHFATSFEAWARRIASGQAMTQMINAANRLGTERSLALWADWTDRIAAGELPSAQPPRPQGIERNVVLTLWDWSRNSAYLHDLIGTDKRDPKVNRHGHFYGSPENSTDYVPVLDPLRHTATEVLHPVRDPKTPSHRDDPMAPSPFWGDKPIWDAQTGNHNPMMDERGRVWFTARIRPFDNPEFCKKGSSHPSAQVFPLARATRHLSMYDPQSGNFTLISTCFPTHHLIFGEGNDPRIWTSSGGAGNQVLGWLDRRMFEKSGDEAQAQGWTPFVLDANGNGKRDAWAEPGKPRNASQDQRLAIGLYAVAVNPQDGSVWGTALGFPGYVVRVEPGADPTHTALTEIYQPPLPGYGPRGGDIDRDGVYWASLSSGHLASFDRRKCKAPLNGAQAVTGQHCPEGWTLYPFPGPQFPDVAEPGSAESSYYTWVDQFGVGGLGRNVPIATGNMNSSLLALVDGTFVNMVVPYPLGFFTKWVEARIDDPDGGWRGRALWTTYSTRTMFHLEGGTQNRPKVVRFQMRPDPLAR